MSTTARGTALITGASAGIGAVHADRLARRGEHEITKLACGDPNPPNTGELS